MTYTYNPSTDIGRIRRTLPDRIEATAIWTDEELQSFLNDEDGWRRATALALETMATDNALVLKVIQVQAIRTDGASLARALLARAATLRTQADTDDANSGDAFDVIEMIGNDFQYRQKILNDSLRSG